LKAFYDCKEIVMVEHVTVALLALIKKSSIQNISTICSLFSDQEQRFAITNHDLPCASLL
jgi:hypothetical protein